MQPNPPPGRQGPVRPARRYTPTALPSPAARAAAFAAILVAGACGGLIGWALTDIQCTGDCAGWAGLGALVGALTAAGGVAVVAVLVLRAMAEWRRDLDPPD